MTNERNLGRWAGALYLIVVVTGMFSLVYVPSRISVSGDPHATLQNIIELESLFRLGVAAFLIKQVAFLLLPLVLYRLLRSVDPNIAPLMVALSVVSVPIALVSLVNRLDVLALLTDPQYATELGPVQVQAVARLSLDAYRNGLLVTNLFWGLWLLPFGLLVFRSGFLPRLLGVFLVLGCVGYVVEVFGHVLSERYADTAISNYVLLPAAIGEIGTCLWLLIFGTRRASALPARPLTHKV